jgi:hypothetical protein
MLPPSRKHIKEKKNFFFYFLMANNHFTFNKSFCFYLTVFFLALPSFVYPKILTRFYSIYFKISCKISAQSDGQIENYVQ